MDDLALYQAAWRESADRVLQLCLSLDADDWATASDCPGWSVQDVLAHLAHLESTLADSDVRGLMPGLDPARHTVLPEWTRMGVADRRGEAPDTLRLELANAVVQRIAVLERLAPLDPEGRPDGMPDHVDWDWRTLLRNRAIDMWVHEQDIRRAVDRPGGTTGVAAEVTVRTFAAALPYVLGKKVAPPPGAVVAWHVHGPVEVDTVLRVREDGRAVPADEGVEPTVRLGMDTETFTVLAAGRRGFDDVEVDVEGDAELARAVVDAMGVTP